MEVIDSCANSNGGCEHVCHQSSNRTLCSCYDGYTLKLDEKSCEGCLLLTQHRVDKQVGRLLYNTCGKNNAAAVLCVTTKSRCNVYNYNNIICNGSSHYVG